MKNRYILLLIAIFATSAQLNAISPSNMAKAARIAFEEGRTYAFSKRGTISVNQKYGILKRFYFDLKNINRETAKQRAIDKLHTKKNFWMAYSAMTTFLLACAANNKYNDNNIIGLRAYSKDGAQILTRLLDQRDPAFYVLAVLPHLLKTKINDAFNHNYDGPNPFAAAEKAADEATLL